jgi:hypothetical protein
MRFWSGRAAIHAAEQAERKIKLEQIKREAEEQRLRQIIQEELQKFHSSKVCSK